MADKELDDLERRLLRGVLVRRLVIGVGAIALGIALLVLSVVLVVQEKRMIRMPLAMALFGVLAIIGGVVTLRVGEIREDLSVHEADPVPWKPIALAAGGLALALALLAAWPLGVYRRVASLASPCRKVLSSKEVVALGGAPFDVAEVEDLSSTCSLTGVEPGGTRRIFSVRIDNERSGYTLDGQLRFFAPRRKEALSGIGDEAWLLERPGEWMIAVKRGRASLYVNLASSRYDEAIVRRIAGALANH